MLNKTKYYNIIIIILISLLFFSTNVWANRTFSSEFIKSQSEGTYVTDILIVLSIHAVLNGLLYEQSFISTYVFFK